MKPIICSYYTTEYTELAERLQASADRFDYPTNIVPVAKIRDSWLETIYWRPVFVLRQLAEFEQDVVWIDADGVIEQDPVLFEDFTADFGAVQHSFKWQANEILGGTMYFANTVATVDFLKAWIRLNDELPKQTLSQRVIPHALEEVPQLKFERLPPQYCQIFDHMKDCGEPVISHWQASRRFRNA